MRGQPGTKCKLTMDVNDGERDPEEGDEIVTTSGKAAYVIESARHVRSSVHPRRFSLACIRIDPADVTGEDCWQIQWYSRSKKGRG